MKKMFVFDYDGTFYRSTQELQDNIKLIEKVRNQGHILVIATGRSYISFMKEVKKYHIQYDYLILSSGALIIDRDEHIINTYPMDLSLVKSVDKLLEPYHARLESQMYIDDFMNSEILSQLSKVIKMTYTFKKDDISYDIQTLIQKYTHEQFKTYVIGGQTLDYVEIISAKTHKANAIFDVLTYVNEKYDIVTCRR